MFSELSKSAFKMASEDPQKKIAKKYEKYEIVRHSLAISEALTINLTNFLRPPFDSQFFQSFNFYFGDKTPGGLKI